MKFCRKEICSTNLFKASIAAIPFVYSKPPLPTRSLRSLRAAARSASCTLFLHQPHLLVAASEKNACLMQRNKVVSKICYNTVIVFSELLATVGWTWGCQPFTYPCSQNVMYCREEICSTYLSKESMPFVKSKPPLPTRSLQSLRAAARSASSALCLHHSHPLVAASEKSTCFMQRSKSGLQDLLQYCDCALSCAMRLLQTNVCGESF